jgi:hypothetical protein
MVVANVKFDLDVIGVAEADVFALAVGVKFNAGGGDAEFGQNLQKLF